MENSKLMVYAKSSNDKKYEALQSLKTFTIAPNLMYATLLPYEKLDRLIEWLKSNEKAAINENISFQIRSAKDRKKVIFQIN